MYYPVSALLIEFLILSVVDTQDSYGYEISQTVKIVADIKESTLYPILKKLEKNFCVAMLWLTEKHETFSAESAALPRHRYGSTARGPIFYAAQQARGRSYV